jgi:hypothetical protein
MSTHNEHDESQEPTNLMSVQKYKWWCRPMTVGNLVNPKFGLLLNLMGRIPRPSRPGESLLNGFTRNVKLHDGEPELLLTALLAIDSTFFSEFPTRNGQPLSRQGMKAVLGEAASTFVRGGIPGYRTRKPSTAPEAVIPAPAFDAAIDAAIRTATGAAERPQADTGADVTPAGTGPGAEPV